MKIINEWELFDDFKIAEVDNYPQDIFQKLVHDNLLHEYPALNWREELLKEEKEQDNSLKEMVKKRFKLRLAVLKESRIIGLTFGWQLTINHSDFYMGISVIEKEYRRKGLYSAMLDKVLAITKKNGFSAIKSRHINTNNSVLIAKLKKGFIINGLEIDETMGSLLRMSYYHNEVRSKAAKFRAGNVSDKYILNMLQQNSVLMLIYMGVKAFYFG